jgi:undecaprenyl-diphosphatase
MNFINSLIPFIESLGWASYFFIFLISLAESLAFIGLIIPGTTFLIIFGFFLSNGAFDWSALATASIMGAIIGDGISFYLGKNNKNFFQKHHKIFKEEYLKKSENFIDKHGNKSVFLGRFIGPLRPIIPFVAGMFNIKTSRFFFWNILSAFGWAALYLSIGYFFGESWKVIATWAKGVKIFFVLLLITLLALYIFKWLIQKAGEEILLSIKVLINHIKINISDWPRLKKFIADYPDLISYAHRRLTRKNFFGLPLTLLLITAFYTLLLLADIAYDIMRPTALIEADSQIAGFIPQLRNGAMINFFRLVTLLGEWQFAIFASLMFCIYLYAKNKKDYLFPFLVSIGGSIIFIWFAKIFFARPRPENAVYFLKSFSFPSGHATIAVAFFGFLIYFFWRNSAAWKNKINFLFVFSTLIFLIGFSRLYLGVHFLSDVSAGYLLGFLWLIIAISIHNYFNNKKLPQ